jgi:hypothetical protein
LRSLLDPTGGRRPFATLNLLAGGCIHVRPSLITKVTAKKGYTEVKYGPTVFQVKEPADRVQKLAETATKMEAEAKRKLG